MTIEKKTRSIKMIRKTKNRSAGTLEGFIKFSDGIEICYSVDCMGIVHIHGGDETHRAIAMGALKKDASDFAMSA